MTPTEIRLMYTDILSDYRTCRIHILRHKGNSKTALVNLPRVLQETLTILEAEL